MSDTHTAQREEYDKALRRLGWTRMDEIPELHDALEPCVVVAQHVQRKLAERTFADVRDAVEVCQMSAIVQQCWVLADYSHRVTAADPEAVQGGRPTGWWIADLGPFPEQVEVAVYKAFRPVLSPVEAEKGFPEKRPWTVLDMDGSGHTPLEQLLAAMTIDRLVFPWGHERVMAKRYPKDKAGHWVYRAPAVVSAVVKFHGIPTHATPSVELTVTEYGPAPPDGEGMGNQPEWRTGRLKFDFVKSLGGPKGEILEVAEKASELAALVRIALEEPTRAGELVTALMDDRYDPPAPGRTRVPDVVMAICENNDVLDLFQQLNY